MKLKFQFKIIHIKDHLTPFNNFLTNEINIKILPQMKQKF
jgi:hypothetical protein